MQALSNQSLISFLSILHSFSEHAIGVSVGEGDVLPIECNEGSVLNIRSAAYGKPPNCAASKSLSVVESLCNGKRRCKVAANNRVFGDPCPGIGKQLTVQYNCYLTGRFYQEIILLYSDQV